VYAYEYLVTSMDITWFWTDGVSIGGTPTPRNSLYFMEDLNNSSLTKMFALLCACAKDTLVTTGFSTPGRVDGEGL